MSDEREVRCPRCKGDGMVEPDEEGRYLCPECDGDGWVWE